MTTKMFCDGCNIDITRRGPELTITRAPMSGGYGMPSGESHLCPDCGRYAFTAMRERQEQLNAAKEAK